MMMFRMVMLNKCRYDYDYIQWKHLYINVRDLQNLNYIWSDLLLFAFRTDSGLPQSLDPFYREKHKWGSEKTWVQQQ